MKTESEQLWYTWSTRGFGSTGFQIRAASPGFIEGNNSVDMQSERIQELLKHVNYVLPPNTKDSSDLPPQQAPVSLAFVQAGQERILVQKSYVTPDGTSKPGTFFTHLVTSLPLVSSQTGPLPFTAREAIGVWNASYWKKQDELEPEQNLLPPVTFPSVQDPGTLTTESDKMRSGSLSRDDLTRVPREQLEFILRAFLMRQSQQRIYIAAEPETIALLLWGLTHCLPRTLDSMHDLTFSTYERIEVERIAPLHGRREGQKKAPTFPTITGTCWPSSQTGDLPVAYYQDQGVNGYALNCYTGRTTPLMLSDSIQARFVLFAIDCLLDENNHCYRELTDILKQAEKEHCHELDHFMRIYISCQETLSQNDVQALIHIVKQRLDNIVEEETMLLADLERLQRDTVQSSIVQWIARNRSWWESTCRSDLAAFFACLDKYRNYPLPSNIQHVIDTLQKVTDILGERVARQVNDAISTDTTDFMYFWMDMLDLTAPLEQSTHIWLCLVQGFSAEDLNIPTFQRWWQIKGEQIFSTIHQNLKLSNPRSLLTPLTPLAKLFVDKLYEALQTQDHWGIDNWQSKLAIIASPQQEPAGWLYLFECTVSNPYHPVYWEWWNAYGKVRAEELSLLGQKNPAIGEKLAQLGDVLVKSIVLMIQQEDPIKGMQSSPSWPVWSLWNEMLSTLVALNSQDVETCRVWLDLWGHLWPYIFTSTYEQWWQRQGSDTSIIIRKCTEAYPESDVGQNVADFLFESILPLTYLQIDHLLDLEESQITADEQIEDPRNNLFMLLRVLLNAIPAHYQETIWLGNEGALLEALNLTILLTTADAVYPWEMHRALLEAWSQSEVLHAHAAILPWLNITWGTIGRLVTNERIVASWRTIAVESILMEPVTLEAPQLKSLLSSPHVWQIFEPVLQSYIQQAETAHITLQFTQHLLDIGYPQREQVLRSLLLASRQQPDSIQALLQQFQPTTTEISTFLEQDCVELTQHVDWPGPLLPLLLTYLTAFDAGRLTQPEVQHFLQQLHQRNLSAELKLADELTGYVEGWLAISTLVNQPTISKRWLRQAAGNVGSMVPLELPLQPQARSQLAQVLWPILTQHMTNEMDLTRALDTLGPVISGRVNAEAEAQLALLIDMAPHASAHYQQKQSLSSLVPYLKIALEQAQELPYPQNEQAIERCLELLCADIELDAYEAITNHAELWPSELQDLWNTQAQKQQGKHTAQTLTKFKQAIQNGDVETISYAYQQVLKEVQYPGTYVNQQERDIALLAGDIVSSYKLRDQAALRQAHQDIQQSTYKERLTYSAEIEQTITELPETPLPRSRATRPLLKHRDSRLLTKVAVQPSPEILKALEQSVLETNARTSIGTVQSKSIMLDQLNKIHSFKRLYIGYRLSTIDLKIKNAPWNSKDKLYYKKEKKDLLEWSRQTDQFLRQKALDDLIDNVFINSGIETRIKQGECGIEDFLLEQRTLENFHQYEPEKYERLVETHNFSETDVKQVLRIFRRRERFAERLLKERYDLDSWLEEKRKLHKEQIQIEFGW